jgi:signal peptidase I
MIQSEAPRGKPRGIFAEPCEATDAISPCGKPQGFLAKKGEQSRGESMWRYIIPIFGLVLLTGCSLKSYNVPTESMEPAIKRGSHVMVDTAYYTRNPVQRFDMIAVYMPDGKQYIRRVIGLGGETIQIQGGKIIVNGQVLKEPFLAIAPTNDFGPAPVPDKQYFLLGDNRPGSFDSRYWRQSTVGQEMIAGKVVEIVAQ